MNVVRYEPWGMLRQFNDEVNRLVNERREDLGDHSRVATSAWSPAVDIKEEDDRFVLIADVPGVDPKDIELTMENGVLTVKGERSREDVKEDDRYRRVERVYGTFYRRFSLPDTADATNISASGRNGVLEIVIPKQEKVQPRRITVS